jgi:hypothetical protein
MSITQYLKTDKKFILRLQNYFTRNRNLNKPDSIYYFSIYMIRASKLFTLFKKELLLQKNNYPNLLDRTIT